MRSLRPLPAAVIALALGLIGLALADDPPAPAVETPAPAGLSLPPDITDPGFDRFLNLADLSDALKRLDPTELTDFALQAADGERVLGRPHKAVSADKLARLTVGVAVANRNAAALDRLGKQLAAGGRADLAQVVDAGKKLAAAGRAPAAPPIDPDTADPDVLAAFDDLSATIRSATLLGDRGHLEGLLITLPTFTLLDDAQHAYLRAKIEDGLKAAPTEPDPTAEALRSLAGVSRATSTVGTRAYNYAVNYLNSKEMILRGECAELPFVAHLNVGALGITSRPKYKGTDGQSYEDYVWGGSPYLTVIKGTAKYQGITAGDVMQFKNVSYKSVNYTYTAYHHTAVVESFTGGNTVNTLEQNAGGVKKVTRGKVYLPGMQAGEIKFYRPAGGEVYFFVEISNKTKKPVAFNFGGQNKTLAAGKSEQFGVKTKSPPVTLSQSSGTTTRTSGGITIGDSSASVTVLEAMRKYEFTGPMTLKKMGWIVPTSP